MAHWQQLEVRTHPQHAEIIADLLHDFGALSVTLTDAGDEPLFQVLPAETPLWQKTKIVALFPAQTCVEDIVVQLNDAMQCETFSYEITLLEDQDWVRQTQQNFPPQCLAESFWVLPSWCQQENYHRPFIKIDPGLAFGTGTHPTTALCLEWLARHPPKNLTVIDFGCGSGILALAACALGAKHVFATDHDPQALEATRNNAALNDLEHPQLQIILSEEMPSIKADLIVANILSQPLIELAPQIKALCAADACLILSGILVTEINHIALAYSPEFKLRSASTREEWARIILEPAVSAD